MQTNSIQNPGSDIQLSACFYGSLKNPSLDCKILPFCLLRQLWGRAILRTHCVWSGGRTSEVCPHWKRLRQLAGVWRPWLPMHWPGSHASRPSETWQNPSRKETTTARSRSLGGGRMKTMTLCNLKSFSFWREKNQEVTLIFKKNLYST